MFIYTYKLCCLYLYSIYVVSCTFIYTMFTDAHERVHGCGYMSGYTHDAVFGTVNYVYACVVVLPLPTSKRTARNPDGCFASTSLSPSFGFFLESFENIFGTFPPLRSSTGPHGTLLAFCSRPSPKSRAQSHRTHARQGVNPCSEGESLLRR
jgi:hypothetical protein